ncbi:hypothetical protein C0075_06640 [Rhizobium sp. KAs_5_22]|uniref:DUF4297 family anti-phage-associated protein n=1 Tax=Ciceribacter selenitireducens TaxID=448181 RepID=UPI00048D2F8C|nr:DUF4297 family anti-phage-associated protein [Ciceribacter selenitireducens]PPJ45431.1 hypothetical protein C0075_06640 [Rhizobium sp. KAs_5_22]
MLEVDKKREATASIRGYFYQLDAALLDILAAGLDDKVVIEGIEDFDRYSADGVTYNQVKYYEAQCLTDSILRDPLHKLFQHFHGLKKGARAGRKYVLYGHYKEIKIALDPLTVERFKEVMTYLKVEEDKSRTKKSHLDGLDVADDVIESFCRIFEIRPAKEFGAQRAEVVSQLRTNQRVTEVEASGFHYPRAFDFVATLATKKNHLDRSTSLRELQDHLKGTQAVHHSWLLREKETAAYGRFMRDLYFSQQNTAGVIRVFILEVDKNTGGQMVADQVLEIAKKWSSADSPRTPNNDRHAPFVMLRNAGEELIQEVKNSFYEQGVEFVDGHPYRGSPFRVEHAQTPQTKERAVAVRFVDNLDQLTASLDGMGRKPRRIYDFFISTPMPLNLVGANVRGFSIPISDLSFIKKIV